MHRKVGRPEAARIRAPGLDAHAGEHDLQDWRVGAVEHRPFRFVEPGGERGRVQDDVERLERNQRLQRRSRRLVLEARHIDGRCRKISRSERVGERGDRREIIGEIDRTIEDDERPWRIRSLDAGALEEAERRDRLGRRRVRLLAPLLRKEHEQRLHVARAALVEIAPELGQRLRRKGRGLLEAGVCATVACNERELDSAFSRERRKLVDAVSPIVGAAQDADDNQPRMSADAARDRGRSNRDGEELRGSQAEASALAPALAHSRGEAR